MTPPTGASAAAAGCVPAAKSLVARVVQVVELPQPARGPRVRTERSAATNHGLATADRRRAYANRGDGGVAGEAGGRRARADLEEDDMARLQSTRGQRGAAGSVAAKRERERRAGLAPVAEDSSGVGGPMSHVPASTRTQISRHVLHAPQAAGFEPSHAPLRSRRKSLDSAHANSHRPGHRCTWAWSAASRTRVRGPVLSRYFLGLPVCLSTAAVSGSRAEHSTSTCGTPREETNGGEESCCTAACTREWQHV